MSKKLTISVSHKIDLPAGTKVIRNDDFITLAKKSGQTVSVFTCESQDVSSFDLTDETFWTVFTKDELKKLAAL